MKSEEKKKRANQEKKQRYWLKQHHSVCEFCDYYFGMGIVPVLVMD